MMPALQCHLGRTRGEAEDGFAARTPAPDAGVVLIGTAAMIADMMEAWFEAGAADGFIVHPQRLPDDAEAFVAGVVPELQRRGLFRRDYEGRSLRANLGLVTQ